MLLPGQCCCLPDLINRLLVAGPEAVHYLDVHAVVVNLVHLQDGALHMADSLWWHRQGCKGVRDNGRGQLSLVCHRQADAVLSSSILRVWRMCSPASGQHQGQCCCGRIGCICWLHLRLLLIRTAHSQAPQGLTEVQARPWCCMACLATATRRCCAGHEEHVTEDDAALLLHRSVFVPASNVTITAAGVSCPGNGCCCGSFLLLMGAVEVCTTIASGCFGRLDMLLLMPLVGCRVENDDFEFQNWTQAAAPFGVLV